MLGGALWLPGLLGLDALEAIGALLLRLLLSVNGTRLDDVANSDNGPLWVAITRGLLQEELPASGVRLLEGLAMQLIWDGDLCGLFLVIYSVFWQATLNFTIGSGLAMQLVWDGNLVIHAEALA